MGFVTLTIQRLLNLYRRAGCAWECVSRELKNYEDLKSYFLSASRAGDRFRRLRNAFHDPVLEIYLFFYQGILPVFTTFNKYLQREEPLINQLSEALKKNPLNNFKFFAKSERRHRSWNFTILTKRKMKQLLENGDVS